MYDRILYNSSNELCGYLINWACVWLCESYMYNICTIYVYDERKRKFRKISGVRVYNKPENDEKENRAPCSVELCLLFTAFTTEYTIINLQVYAATYYLMHIPHVLVCIYRGAYILLSLRVKIMHVHDKILWCCDYMIWYICGCRYLVLVYIYVG